MIESPPSWKTRWMPSFVKKRRVAVWRQKARQRQGLQQKTAEAGAGSVGTLREIKRIQRPGHPVHLLTTLDGRFSAACDKEVLERADEEGDLILNDGAWPGELLDVTCEECLKTDKYYQWTRQYNIAKAQCCFAGKRIGAGEWIRAILGRSQWQYFTTLKKRSDGAHVYRVCRWQGNNFETTDAQSETRGALEVLCFRGHWSPAGMMPGDHGYREFHVATGADDLVYRLNRGLPPQGFLLAASIIAGLVLLVLEAPGFFLAIRELQPFE